MGFCLEPKSLVPNCAFRYCPVRMPIYTTAEEAGSRIHAPRKPIDRTAALFPGDGLPVCPSVCLSVSLSLCLSVCLFVCLVVWLSSGHHRTQAPASSMSGLWAPTHASPSLQHVWPLGTNTQAPASSDSLASGLLHPQAPASSMSGFWAPTRKPQPPAIVWPLGFDARKPQPPSYLVIHIEDS